MPLFRRLSAGPVFTAFAVVTLALGIGATTAIYAVAEAVLFRPLDIRDVDEVVNIYHADPSHPAHATAVSRISLSWPDVEDIEALQTVFDEMMTWSRFQAPLTGTGQFTTVLGELVSGNYFAFVGAGPLLGRVIQPADDDAAAPPVVALAEPFWRRTFGGDSDIVGRTITLGGRPVEVVGVVPASFRGVDMPNVLPTQAWMPLRQAGHVMPARRDRWNDREHRWVFVKARLGAGHTIAEARAGLLAIGRQLDRVAPIGDPNARARGGPEDVRRFAVLAAADRSMHESVDFLAVPAGQAVLAAAALVLLVACTNLANMLLARGARRHHEVAVRRALGATRWQVVRELARESLVISAAGGLAGIAFAWWLVVRLSGAVPVGTGLSLTIEPRMTSGVFAVGLAATVAAALLFGLAPAWRTTQVGLRPLLDADTGASGGRWRGRRWLVAAQVSVSVAILVPGALLARQAVSKAFHDPGFDLDRLAAVQIGFHLVDRIEGGAADEVSADARRTRRLEVLAHAVERARRTPGIAHAALVNRLPVYFGSTRATRVGAEPPSADSRAAPSEADLRRVTYPITGDEQLFDAIGVRMLAGRPFDAADVRSHAPVVVISRAVADAVYGEDHVVGRTMFVGAEVVTVVGVAADTDWSTIGRRRYGFIYRPGQPAMDAEVVLAARASADPAGAVLALRAILRDLDRELPVVEGVTGPMIVARQTAFDRIGAELVTLLGAFALALALTGLAGLLSYVVASRRRELGVRMALGADRRRIARMVIVDGLKPVLAGGAAGLAVGALLSGLVGTYFYRLPALDWGGIAFVAVLLVLLTVAACYVPAARAAAIEPNAALRDL